MGLMLNLISLTPNISAFLIQISHKRPYAEGIVIILQPHSRRKNDVKFVNKDMLINNLAPEDSLWLKLVQEILDFFS